MRVFLTGATGLVGSHLAELLVGEGHEVVALCRAGADPRFLEELCCDIAEGDVQAASDALAAAMERCTHLVHAAALVYSGASWPEVRGVNVVGTRRIFEAAREAGVGAAVHVSSVAVYGQADGPIDEQSPVDGPLPVSDFYARSKREAEKEARTIESSGGPVVTVVRPAAVYGERDRLMAPRIARLTRSGFGVLLGSGANTLPAVYAGNVADAIFRILMAGDGGTYDIGCDYPLTQRQLMEGIARGMGRRLRTFSIPRRLVTLSAAVLARARIPAPGAGGLPLARVARLAVGENPYSSHRLRERLGWIPPHDHDAALERTGRWLRDHI